LTRSRLAHARLTRSRLASRAWDNASDLARYVAVWNSAWERRRRERGERGQAQLVGAETRPLRNRALRRRPPCFASLFVGPLLGGPQRRTASADGCPVRSVRLPVPTGSRR